MLNTEILKGGIELIDRTAHEWTDLCDEGVSGEPFFRPEWFAAFVKNFEADIQLLTVRRNGALRALLPILKKRGVIHGVPVRKIQAAYNLNTPRFDLVHGADETERKTIVDAVWRALSEAAGWDVLEFRLVKRESWLGSVLEMAERDKYPVGIWPMDGAPFITLPQSDDKQRSMDDFFRGPRKHLRQELDRRLRRLKERGTVEFVVTQGCTPELMQTYFRLEAKGWKGRGGTAVTDDPSVARMHEDFAASVTAKNSLFVYQLKLDGKTIAMSLNIRYGKETIHWKTSYDEEFARYSPGNILFRELVRDSIEQGSGEIDFLSPATPNKKFWASGEREHVAFYVFNRSLFGSLLWRWKFRVVSGLRELKSGTPEKIETARAQG